MKVESVKKKVQEQNQFFEVQGGNLSGIINVFIYDINLCDNRGAS